MAINQLDQVKDLFTVLEEATPRWIHISGESGSGKTRLLHLLVSTLRSNIGSSTRPEPLVEMFDWMSTNIDCRDDATRMEQYFYLLDRKVAVGVKINTKTIIGIDEFSTLVNATANPIQMRTTFLNIVRYSANDLSIVTADQNKLSNFGLLGARQYISKFCLQVALGNSAIKLARETWIKGIHDAQFAWLKAQENPCVVLGCEPHVQLVRFPEVVHHKHQR